MKNYDERRSKPDVGSLCEGDLETLRAWKWDRNITEEFDEFLHVQVSGSRHLLSHMLYWLNCISFSKRVGTIWNSWPSTINAFIRIYSKPRMINWNSNFVILPHNERKPVSRRSSKVCSVKMLIAMWNRCPYHATTVYCGHTISVRLGIKTVPKVNRRNVWNSINRKWSLNSSTMCRCVLDSNIQWKWIKLETFTICAATINRGNWMRPVHGVL